jgi:L,D-transpeptidase YcbB
MNPTAFNHALAAEPISAGLPVRRAASCLHGLAAVVLLWLLLLGATAVAAQEPEAQRWNREAASALSFYVARIGRHGLDPDNYGAAELGQAISSDDAALLERSATHSFGLVAVDLARGRIRPGDRGRNYIVSDAIDPVRIASLIDVAIATKDPGGVLERLAPSNPQYAALQKALAALPADRDSERRKIEVSLERWRWLPRALGERHLLVNIPEYRARLFDEGAQIASHRVIVGTLRTPTPQFSTEVTGVILNPSWYVPQSIIAESVGRLVRTSPATARQRGYTWSSNSGRLQVTQQPGPNNALGQMKLDMPNPLSIFLHDTPNKDLFEREARTFSHGCIRTQDPFGLAEKLLVDVSWTRAMIDQSVAARQTRRVPLSGSVPVHVVYLTAFAKPDGTIDYLDDPYSLDAAVAAKLR